MAKFNSNVPVDMSQWGTTLLQDVGLGYEFLGGAHDETPTSFDITGFSGNTYTLGGNFTYDSDGTPDGKITSLSVDNPTGNQFSITGFKVTFAQLETYAANNDATGLENAIFGKGDTFTVGPGPATLEKFRR